MENTITILVSAVVSGIFATIITLWWQNKSEKEKTRQNIFSTLMAYRFNIAHEESVKALNSIQVFFYKDKSVLTAWHEFKAEVDRIPADDKRIIDAHIKLLEEVGKACGYSNIKWNEIKDYYYPVSLSDEINENQRLRKANLQIVEAAVSANQ